MSSTLSVFIDMFVDGKCTRESFKAFLDCDTIDMNETVDEDGNTPLTQLCMKMDDFRGNDRRSKNILNRMLDCIGIMCQSPYVDVSFKVGDMVPVATYLVENYYPFAAINHVMNNATFDPNATSFDNITLFHAALLTGSVDVVNRLLEFDGVDLSIRPTAPSDYIPTLQYMPLIVAVHIGAPKAVAALLELPSTNINEGIYVEEPNDTWLMGYETGDEVRVLLKVAQRSWTMTVDMLCNRFVPDSYESDMAAQKITELVCKLILDNEELDVNSGEPLLFAADFQATFVKQLWGRQDFDVHHMEACIE